MALTHLLDTSVLTRVNSPRVRDALEPYVREGAAGRAGIADLEIGFSARSAAEWDSLTGALEVLTLVETTAAHIQRARVVQRLLAEKHQRGRKVPDLLIAAAAEGAGLTVLHYDADFDRIARITGQPTEWIVPRGSED
jgi:predicted nucleic acid-binding protein